MSGGQVSVNDHAIGQAQAMITHINAFQTTVDTLRTHGENMKGHWQGRHADQFQTVWAEAHKNLTTAHQNLHDVRNAIQRIMTNIQQAGNS